jgi:hypothetical protein
MDVFLETWVQFEPSMLWLFFQFPGIYDCLRDRLGAAAAWLGRPGSGSGETNCSFFWNELKKLNAKENTKCYVVWWLECFSCSNRNPHKCFYFFLPTHAYLISIFCFLYPLIFYEKTKKMSHVLVTSSKWHIYFISFNSTMFLFFNLWRTPNFIT